MGVVTIVLGGGGGGILAVVSVADESALADFSLPLPQEAKMKARAAQNSRPLNLDWVIIFGVFLNYLIKAKGSGK